jgi:hypothetical protein
MIRIGKEKNINDIYEIYPKIFCNYNDFADVLRAAADEVRAYYDTM